MTADSEKERGSALLGVMLFSGLAATVMAILVAQVVVERRAVEDSIAQTRAYWAAMGFNNYVLSRTLVNGACTGKGGCSSKGSTDYSPQAQTYLNEISDMQNWYYMDIGPSYYVQLNSQACQDSNTPQSASGEIVIKTAFSGNGGPNPPAPSCPTSGVAAPCAAPAPIDSGTIESLRSLRVARPVEFHYCLVGVGVGTCGGGPTIGTAGGPQLITSVHRPAC